MNFSEYWQYTDIVTKSMFFALIFLSVCTWSAGIIRLYNSIKLKKIVGTYLGKRVKAKFNSIDDVLSKDERKLITEQVLLQAISRLRYGSEKGMSILATTAAIAPFIGLFGTVWGIFHALHVIGKSGQAGLAQVAGPVGEALIMTGLGLAVAIPAVVFYNIIGRVNRGLIYQANDTAHELLANCIKQQAPSTIDKK